MLGQYESVYLPEHPRAIKSNGNVYLHILIAEKKLGRSLGKNEVVHHIDENKNNNSPENLIVFASQADHFRYHRTGCLQQCQDYYFSSVPTHPCEICGQQTSNLLFCSPACRSYSQRKKERPSREILKEEIRKTTFTALGKKYGVSDKTISNWCQSYNLPYKKNLIRILSETEWMAI